MNIQELEIKCAELGAEIQRLKRQPVGVWEPKRGDFFFMVDFVGDIRAINPNHTEATTHHNVYKTRQLAEKASVLQRRSNLIIQACLHFDPDFVIDWDDREQDRYGFHYHPYCKCWISYLVSYEAVAYVSTLEIAEKVAEYLNSQEIK